MMFKRSRPRGRNPKRRNRERMAKKATNEMVSTGEFEKFLNDELGMKR
jgi:hypothetical protein